MVKPNIILFAFIYLVVFCFGFLISVITNFNFRAAPISLLVLPLLLIWGLRIERVFISYGILALIIFLSGLLNGTSFTNILLFLRTLIFSYLIYFLVKITFTSPEFTKSVMKTSVWVGMIQLPILLLQWQLYDLLPIRFRGPAYLVDFASGTFIYKTDYAMAFFITMVIVFLLFENKRNYFIKNKFYKAIWLSITVLIANSQIMKIAVLLIWLVYVIKNLGRKNILIIGFGIMIAGATLFFLSNTSLITEDIATFIYNLTNPGDVDVYLSGGYSRTAALRYLLTQGFSWLGAGPNAFFDPINRTVIRGNMGHSFTFFSEIGMLGWLFSIFIIFLIAFPMRDGRIQLNLSRILIFVSMFILSFTSNVMNDIGVFLAFCIGCNSHMIPKENEEVKKETVEGSSNVNYNNNSYTI